MFARTRHIQAVRRLIKQFPVVAVIGPRQVGKSTLARQLAGPKSSPRYFDLEKPADLARLKDPELALGRLTGLVVIDEIQRRPELFQILRVLSDRRPRRARFLVLGSAAPTLLRQTSESLAGRIAYYELPGLSVEEAGAPALDRLWLRGGFPESFLAASEVGSFEWRWQFVRAYLERDLPALGVRFSPVTLERFWTMIAHYHGQTWNASEIGRALGAADTTVRNYLDTLASAFVVTVLQPWHENIAKRQIKAPKVYVTDSGLMHALLNIQDGIGLDRHPKVGASWEGFILHELCVRFAIRRRERFYWRSVSGAELDFLAVRGRHRTGFEIKRTTAPMLTPSMRSAMTDLKLDRLFVIHAGDHAFDLARNVYAVPAPQLDAIRIGGFKQ